MAGISFLRAGRNEARHNQFSVESVCEDMILGLLAATCQDEDHHECKTCNEHNREFERH